MQTLRCRQRISQLHQSTDKEHSDPEFSVDYAFMTLKGEIEHGFQLSDEDKIGASPVLVGYGHRSRGIWAMAVDHKGATESSIDWMESKLNQAGCRGTKVVLKSDQEEFDHCTEESSGDQEAGGDSSH